MSRSKPLRILETFALDPTRCAAALLRLLAREPKDPAAPPAPACSAGTGTVRRSGGRLSLYRTG